AHLRVDLRNDEGKMEKPYVHALVLAAFVGPCPDGMHVLHYDDDAQNNNLDNLRYGTIAENKADAVRNGLHPGALSQQEKEQIVKLVDSGVSFKRVAEQYACSLRTVSKVVTEYYST
ncbi:MAG: HNH endonuclease, partial [Ruegeria sp.]